jgi:hypothetical protein
MKKKENAAPNLPENATPPATEALPVTEVTAPPITENATPPTKTETTVMEVTAPPVENGTPTTTAPVIEETTPAAQVESVLPPPGKGSRSLDDYRKLDWTKTNAELARETGVSRQRISQIRKEIENKPAPGTPDFGDVCGNQAQATAVEQVVNYDVMAVSVFDMSTGVLTMIFGNEWQPKSQEEKQMVCTGLKTYFQSKQMQDLPPGLMLTAICLAYAAPRLREPNTSSKLAMAWAWCKMKVSSFRKKK